ncbi:uncharacterized protein LOC119771222 isoform X1 [Culex quinquefasciatus]|uniref:uncharacterized protein LOC119771222 isoform X1 n=1 Tax=Culex quinquefasciatus TaxID=7176 RepID=UPI0018E2D764|nr:uncharacterized protein LOC119771222 isoform X1 [Culex quinquefasciatus]
MAPRGLLILVVMLGGVVRGGAPYRRQVKQLAWEVREMLQTCSGRNDSQWNCLWDQGLAAVDDFVNREKIPLVTGVSLVRVKAGKVNASNPSSAVPSDESKNLNSVTEDSEQSKTWAGRVLDALDHMFETHVLQIDLVPRNSDSARGQSNHTKQQQQQKMSNDVNGWWQKKKKGSFRGFETEDVGEGRHRRRQQMIPMMIFGVVVFGSFVIPMGFQFLAALSGKAFLMAKLALLLASINGLKRVAQPGVHYGLYHHVDQHPHHLHGSPGVLYDRDNGFGPRNLPPVPPPSSPHPTE